MAEPTETVVSEYTWSTFLSTMRDGEATAEAKSTASVVRGRTYSAEWVSASDSRVECMADFDKVCRDGWQGGEQRIAQQAQRLTAQITRTMEQQVLEADPTGFIIDPAALASGLPDYSYSYVLEQVQGPETPHVHVVLQACASAGVSAEVLERRGAAVAALIYALELAGRRVKATVIASFGASGYARRTPLWESRILVKDYGEDLDPNRIAVCFAHPAFFRVGCFALQDSDAPGKFWSRWGSGRGSVCESAERGDIYMDGAFLGEAWDDAWIKRKLEEQGVRFI